MTYPGQPNYGAPQYQPQQPTPQYQQGMGVAPGQFVQPGAPQQAYAPPAQPQYQQPMPAQFPQQGGTGQFFTQQDPHVQAQQPAAPPPMPAQPVDTSAFFGGAATISWDAAKGYRVGTFRGGQIIDKKIVPQTKLGSNEILKWGDGSVREQMVITLQTSERADPQDNGQRQLFLKGDAPRAAREAFQAVGAKDLELGGWYYQAWVDEKPAKQVGYNPQKIFKGVYATPGSPDPMAGQQPYQAQQFQQPAPGPLGTAPQQAVANFAQVGQPQQPSAFVQAAAPEVAQMNQQSPVMQAYAAAQQPPQLAPQQQSYQGQQMPYGTWVGDVSVQQAPMQNGQQTNGQHPEQAPQQFAQPATPQGQAASGYNPFGPTG